MEQPKTSAQEMRDSLRVLPQTLQPAVTWFTGLPATGEQPLIRWGPFSRLATSMAVLGGSVSAAWFAATAGGLAATATLALALLTAGAMRYLYVVVAHFCVHGSMHRSERVNRVVGELVTLLTCNQGYDSYKREHARFHHSARLATPADPDTKLLAEYGFLPGLSVSTLKRRLLWTVMSPFFHLRMTAARLRAQLARGPVYRRVLTGALWAVLLGVVAVTGEWMSFLLAWLLPVGVLYNVSALVQLLTEHRWYRRRRDGETKRQQQAKLTSGRFLGDPAPTTTLGWVGWTLRALLLHAPARLFVLVGDLPQHDLHHLQPRGEWANAAFTRREVVKEKADTWPRTGQDEWHGSMLKFVELGLSEMADEDPLSPSELTQLRQPPG